MQRRDFLGLFLTGAGCFAALASGPFAPRLGASEGETDGKPRFRFPQGLASGDPTQSSVVLWTRVEAIDGQRGPVRLIAQVSSSEDFSEVVAEQAVTADEGSDHTVRVLVINLKPDTVYFYRFRAGADATPLLGRTRTAPTPDNPRPVRIAWASCQAYEGGYYQAWRSLLNEDAKAPAGEQVDFVLHLGDFIYEALGYGNARRIASLPSGGGSAPGFAQKGYARTLEDYRFLYKTYLSDPDLQAARARWPFVVTWDDHEFSDDCWQSASTYRPEPCAEQSRRLFSNQAWFEYIPALLSGHPGSAGVASEARDFLGASVVDAPFSGAVDEEGIDQEPNNLAAIESLRIYRSFRWGRQVEMIVTDTRSHRSAHCVPAELNKKISGNVRNLSPCGLVRLFDAGRTANGGRPPSEISVAGATIPNLRREAPPGTMLGGDQKRWFKATLAASTARWKVWGNSIPLQPLRIDLQNLDPKAVEHAFSIDSWDGYPSERDELLGFVAEKGIANFVSLSGDHHAHIAGSLAAAFDGGETRWVGAEFSGAGISAQSLWEGVMDYTGRDHPLAALVVCAGGGTGGTAPAENLNTTFLWGARAAVTLAKTGSAAAALQARNPGQNRHLAYCDTHAYGIAVARFSEEGCAVQMLSIRPPKEDRAGEGGELLRRAVFTLPSWDAGAAAPKLAPPRIEGEPPFPLSAT